MFKYLLNSFYWFVTSFLWTFLSVCGTDEGAGGRLSELWGPSLISGAAAGGAGEAEGAGGGSSGWDSLNMLRSEHWGVILLVCDRVNESKLASQESSWAWRSVCTSLLQLLNCSEYSVSDTSYKEQTNKKRSWRVHRFWLTVNLNW